MFNIFPKNNIAREETKKFSLYLLAIALILSAVIFLMLIDNSKNYTAKTSIIFIPKSELAAKDSEHIIENMRVLPAKLSFYNKMIRDNHTEDAFSGLSDNKKESLWNEKIKIQRDGKSSILDISILGNNPEEVKNISEATIFTLFNVIGFYYDIRNDVDLKIIQKTEIEASTGNWFWIIIVSLIIGTAISFAINFISNSISNLIFKKQEIFKYKFRKPVFDFEKFKPKKITEKEKPTVPETKKSETENATAGATTKKSSAPTNLPTAPGNLAFIDEDYFRNNIIKGAKSSQETTAKPQESAEVESELIEKTDVHREPTSEELKKRLNQLLRGEL